MTLKNKKQAVCWEKTFIFMYLMKDLYPEYIKNPYNSIIKNQFNEKWAKI